MERFAIPDDIQKSGQDTFGAGDTTYLMIQPIWSSEQDIVNPVEISISQDGRIFVADEGQSSILVLDQSGNLPDGFEDLRNLVDNHNNEISPIDVDIDKKMNVFYIDGLYGINIGMKLVLVKLLQVLRLFTLKLEQILQPAQDQIFGYRYLMIAIGKLLRAK